MKEIIWMIVAACLVVFGVASCQNTEWYKENERANDARSAAEATPHIIRSADGCKVYAFHAGDSYHYFTRCENTTMTQRNYTENCGKNCVHHKTEEITTENSK